MNEVERDLFRYISNQNKLTIYPSRRKNINPKLWGPHGWKFIDKVIEGYPVSRPSSRDRAHMTMFLTSMGHSLPCETCRTNHTKFTLVNPPQNFVSSRAKLRKWFKAYKSYSSPHSP